VRVRDAMTPRHADIVFVLEGVPGVRDVFALTAATRHAGGYEIGVHLESPRALLRAHYALLRVLGHADMERVHFFYEELAPVLANGASRLVLGDADREDAKARVAPAPPVPSIPPPSRRRLGTPPPYAPFSVLLVDLDDELHDALRRIFREESRHLFRVDIDAAAETALSEPFHVVFCSARAVLADDSFLERLASEDHAGAARVIVVAPARDVPYVRNHLETRKRTNLVLASPIDDAILRREVFRDHPGLVARVAVAESAGVEDRRLRRPRFRPLRVLVVDEDVTTRILHSASEKTEGVDVVVAATAFEVLDHVGADDVDLVVCSATFRADSGEPLYRLVWRMNPELKARTILLAAAESIPPSKPGSAPPRVVQRPLDKKTIETIVQRFTRS
jgi:hypothetical protein